MNKKIPFEFIQDLLSPLELTIKPMFGCHAIYYAEKIVLIVRKKDDHTDSNGVWIATGKEHHASLKQELPSMKSIYILSNGKNETGWQMVHEEADDFEESAAKICEMILKGDQRIGKPRPIPKGRKRKASKSNSI